MSQSHGGTTAIFLESFLNSILTIFTMFYLVNVHFISVFFSRIFFALFLKTEFMPAPKTPTLNILFRVNIIRYMWVDTYGRRNNKRDLLARC